MSNENQDNTNPVIALLFLAGVGVMCWNYKPMLGLVIGVGGFLLFRYILYVFFLNMFRTLK